MQVRERERLYQIIRLFLTDYSATLHKTVSINKHLISAFTLLVARDKHKLTLRQTFFLEEGVNKKRILQDFTRNPTQEGRVFFLFRESAKLQEHTHYQNLQLTVARSKVRNLTIIYIVLCSNLACVLQLDA